MEAGQVLLRLSGTIVQANLSIVENTLAQLYARRARLRAEISDAPSFTTPEDLATLTNSKAAKTFIDSEQNLFNSRRSALIGMKKQLATRKDQLADEAHGMDVQIEATNNELTIVREDVSKTQELYAKGLVTLQRLNLLKRQLSISKASRANIWPRVHRRWVSSAKWTCNRFSLTRTANPKSPRI